ncbi:MAG: 3-hydroxyacyl-CoA dehydrogenase [Betaproteobacteria bacterium HGW-Betaproteobacteria-7]|nr:MAG: 3-hydroxyacyl-CoA dehydrogenase [Betaproteobacteria bacterium HGW-Betaproteobacteria-7]
MQRPNFLIRRVAVLGAGVMGAQIAAHLANADVPVVLFDLPAKEGNKNGVVKKAIDGLKKMQPAPFASKGRVAHVDMANYEEHLAQLAECDLIIEAIAEKMEWKDDLYRKIAPHIAPNAIIASNTSGLSINRLAETLPATARNRFCGIHFFNPPRYMALVELIATRDTDAATLDNLESWLVSRLGKGIVRAKDTPNFVANRVGVFSILAVMHHTERLGLGFDTVDALTGPKIGRAKSATYRTADVVGLDTMTNVIRTMHETLPDDPWFPYYQAPSWLSALIAQGALGQKTKGGIFKKVGKDIQVLDPSSGTYLPSVGEVAPEIEEILKLKDPAERFKRLREARHPQGQFLWAIFRDVFHYIAVHLEDIADNARDVDFALRWGFGWAQGPFETWQAAGWKTIADAIRADIAAGLTMSSVPLPAWVFERDGVHEAAGSWSAAESTLKPRSTLAVYGRQLYPETVLSEAAANPGTTIWENDGVRLWTHPVDTSIAIVSFKAKMHAIGGEVLDGVLEAVARAEKDFAGLVLWHEAPFAVGANLKQVADACKDKAIDFLDAYLNKFQQATGKIKYAQVPTVAAVQGMALGGGCEFVMHAAHRVLALESYVGLVEAGVGLIPAGGGCKEFALSAAKVAATQAGNDPFPFLQNAFMTVSMAKTSASALEAQELGFAREADDIVFNPHELLYIAIRRARAMAEAGYRPPLRARNIPVAGRPGIATLEMTLVNMKEGGFISAHDYRVARSLAVALCGGEVDQGTLVDEDWLLAVERREFLALLQEDKTVQRIVHMLETGKPLRN